jgi:uncharacterized protein (DUF1778 family)
VRERDRLQAKTSTIISRLSPTQHEMIADAARLAGMTVSKFVRMAALANAVPLIERAERRRAAQ